MAFQLNTATALPSEVQLGKEKPQGAFCLRSRYALSANSASSWNAGTTLTLPLQTGTPGTFTDVKQGIIQCTVQICNTNPYVDYLNFGPSGAMIFFDEMRIYSSGTPVEENLRYSETADLLTIQGGHQCRPFHVYRRNKWRAANGLAGDKHVNFIKPSMVDSCGVPLFGLTPFMDKNSAVYHPPSISFGSQNAAVDGSIYEANAAKTKLGADSFGQLHITDGNFSFNDTLLSKTYTAPNSTDNSAFNDDIPSSDYHRVLDITTYDPENPQTSISYQTGLWRNTVMSTLPPTAAMVAVAKHLPSAQHVPSEWPNYQPSTLCGEFDDEEIDTILGKAKISEYFKYLCNVRSLPIGVRGNVNPGGYHLKSDRLEPLGPGSSEANARRFLEYRVSMPFLSGIYGIFAEKMFPDMLIGANNIRIEFKLAQNAKALWTTMDPCRRVPGTLRDFATFTGRRSGLARNSLVANLSAGSAPVASVDPADAALGCANSVVITLPSNVDEAATRVVKWTEMYSTLSALGQDYVPPMIPIQPPVVSYVPASGPSPITVEVDTITQYTWALYKASFSSSSNLPKPQYVPSASPWEAKEDGILTYINEKASCYGTYLPAAQAQSRRCWINTKLAATGDAFANSGQVSFTIRDIQYVGEQVQLDDVVTSAIIQSAAASEIVVWTRGYRSFEASCDQNIQQNIILPIQIGQAEALYLLFRPSVIMNSPDYYSNSFYCPFVGLSYSGLVGSDGVAYDVGGSYSLESSLDTSAQGAFSYQLFSGTKQYPLQPIQTVTELLTEREKSQHNLHNWNLCSTENMSLVNWGNKFGAKNSATGMDLDPFMDFGYFTTFVSVFALDDQTITQNPYLQVAEVSDGDATGASAVRIRGRRCPAGLSSPSGQGFKWEGVLNEFMSPIGSFYLGWDFESWTNHQDLMRTGKFLGQEQLSIRMTGTYLCTASNVLAVGQAAQTQNIMCTAIVPHVVKMSFVPGGHMLTYY